MRLEIRQYQGLWCPLCARELLRTASDGEAEEVALCGTDEACPKCGRPGNPLSHTCPFCAEPPGNRCKTKAGCKRAAHLTRLQLVDSEW